MDLQQARSVIDEVNDELVTLLERRMDAVVEVTRYKRDHGLPVLDEARERDVLDRACARLSNPAYAPAVRAVFRAVMDAAKDYEREHL